MENTVPPSPSKSSDSMSMQITLGIFWLVSLVIAGLFGYSYGKGGTPTTPEPKNTVLGTEITRTPPTATPAPDVMNTAACTKSGYAQKWEFLRSYTIKEGDKLPEIAEKEMGNEDRVNEIMQINGIGPLVVGSTLYLPPESVTKSSGNLKQVHGRIIEKNASVWHLSFNGDKKGMGILIPTYWFEEIPGKDSYELGSCITVLLDDGFKVFSVTRQ